MKGYDQRFRPKEELKEAGKDSLKMIFYGVIVIGIILLVGWVFF